jgi:hypothetical protein
MSENPYTLGTRSAPCQGTCSRSIASETSSRNWKEEIGEYRVRNRDIGNISQIISPVARYKLLPVCILTGIPEDNTLYSN